MCFFGGFGECRLVPPRQECLANYVRRGYFGILNMQKGQKETKEDVGAVRGVGGGGGGREE